MNSKRPRVYTAPIPKMPVGLIELMEGLAKSVLKNNPDNVYEFCSQHMEKLLLLRDGDGKKNSLTLAQKITNATEKVRQRAETRRKQYDTLLRTSDDDRVKRDMTNAVDTPEDKEDISESVCHNLPKLVDVTSVEKGKTKEALVDMSSDKHEKIIETLVEISSEELGKNVETVEATVDMSTEEKENNIEVAHLVNEQIVTSESHVTPESLEPSDNLLKCEENNERNENKEKGERNINEENNDRKQNEENNEQNEIAENNERDENKETNQRNKNEENNDSIQNKENNERNINEENNDRKKNEKNDINEIKENNKRDENKENNEKNINQENNDRDEKEKNNETIENTENDDRNKNKDNNGMGENEEKNERNKNEENGTEVNNEKNKNEENNERNKNEENNKTNENEENNKKNKNYGNKIEGNIEEINVVTEEKNNSKDNELEEQNDLDRNLSEIQSSQVTTLDRMNTDPSTNEIEDKITETNNKVIEMNNLTEGKDTPQSLPNHVSIIINDSEEDVTSRNSNNVENIVMEPTQRTKSNAEIFTSLNHLNPGESYYEKDLDDEKQNALNNTMDLETAAITIQKVFRTFLFRSKTSSIDEATNVDINSLITNSSNEEPELLVIENVTKERRTLGLSRMDTVLQTVNEEKSLSLSTDDSSLSSAATIIQAHVRGFLVRNRLNSNKTTSNASNLDSDAGNSLEKESSNSKNKTILNIHIVPEGENLISRDESMITSMDLSLDGSPPDSTNLHPLGYNKNERRKQLKREDAVQSISPPSNNSGKSDDIDSVKEIAIGHNDPIHSSCITYNDSGKSEDIDHINKVVIGPNDTIHSKSITNKNSGESGDFDPIVNIVIDHNDTIHSTSITNDYSGNKDNIDSIKEIETFKTNNHGKMMNESGNGVQIIDQSDLANFKQHNKIAKDISLDEMDVVTPFKTVDINTSRLMHSGEFHDIVLPTIVSRSNTSVAREFQNVFVYFLLWNNP